MISFIFLLILIYIFQYSAVKGPFLDEVSCIIDPLRNKTLEDKAKQWAASFNPKSTYLYKCLKSHRYRWPYKIVTMIRVFKSYLDFRGVPQLSTICYLFLKLPQPFWMSPVVLGKVCYVGKDAKPCYGDKMSVS